MTFGAIAVDFSSYSSTPPPNAHFRKISTFTQKVRFNVKVDLLLKGQHFTLKTHFGETALKSLNKRQCTEAFERGDWKSHNFHENPTF